jgi:ABC-type branched-subunit amino acid transport system substrate-binding protein
MAIGLLSGQAGNFGQGLAGIKARIAAQNAAGGIGGHQIKLLSCDMGTNANAPEACARSAVSDHVAAVLGWIGQPGPSFFPPLTAAGIPVFNQPAVPPGQAELAPDSFPVTGGSTVASLTLGQAALSNGCKKVGVIAIQGVGSIVDEAAFAVQRAGGTVVANEGEPITLPDYSAPVQQAISKGAQCLIFVVIPTEAAKVINAVAQSSQPNMLLLGPQDALPSSLLAGLVGKTSHVIATGEDPSASISGASQFRNELHADSPGVQPDPYSLAGWLGADLFTHVASGIHGPVTAASVLAAANAANHVDLGPVPAYTSPTKIGQPVIGACPRLTDFTGYTFTVQGSELVGGTTGVDLTSTARAYAQSHKSC